MRKVNAIIFVIFVLVQAVGIYFILDISETFFFILEYLRWIQGIVFLTFILSLYLVLNYFFSTSKNLRQISLQQKEIEDLQAKMTDMEEKLKEHLVK